MCRHSNLGYFTDKKLTQPAQEQQNEISDLPNLTENNLQLDIFTFPSFSINEMDLECLLPSKSNTDKTILRNKQTNQAGDTDWLPDSIIDGFLYEVLLTNNDSVFLTTAASQIIFREGASKEEVSKFVQEEKSHRFPKKHADCSKIILPRNINRNHWIMFRIFPLMKQILCEILF